MLACSPTATSGGDKGEEANVRCLGKVAPALIAFSVCMLPCTSEAGAVQDNARVVRTYGRLALPFVENRGQVDEQAKFTLCGPNGSALFTKDSVVLRLKKGDSHNAILRISFADPDPDLSIEGRGRLPGRANYLIGSDPSKWITAIPTYEGVTYQGVWPGIDVIYKGEGNRLKYDIRVLPSADMSRIKLVYEGARSISLTGSGDLVVNTAAASFREGKPRIYQENGKEKVWLDGGFTLDGNTVGFEVGGYDPSLVLVIDPASDLSWSTFLGAGADDTPYGVAVDSSECAYVVGKTLSSDFPTTPGALDTTHGDYTDVFVAKLSADGSALVYSTFIGGSGDDAAYGIAVDSSGCAYVAGATTSSDFPTPTGYDTTYNGFGDAFVAKLDTAGSQLVYSTFLGGPLDADEARGIAVDQSGYAFATGRTESWDFPVTPGVLDTTYNDDGNGYADAFVTKISPSGLALAYSTFLGGSKGADEGRSVALDSSGCAYVAGSTSSSNFPTPTGYDTTHNGETDVFVSKLDATGSALVYSTFIGGAGSEWAYGLALDPAGCAYIVGSTYCLFPPRFPVTPAAYDTTANGSFDAIVTKLDSSGMTLAYSTFLGGSGFDVAYAVAVDSSGRAHVAGATLSPNFPVTPLAYDTIFGGDNFDAFVTKLNSAGSVLIYSTFLGDSGSDSAYGIALDPSGSAYVTGYTTSAGFPVTSGAFDPVYNDLYDCFITKLSLPETMGLSTVRLLGNLGRVETHGAVVTASFPGVFYIEADNRECGIRVHKSGHGLTEGMRAGIVGTVKTNADGERYIDATTVVQEGDGSVEPLGLTNRAVGGGDWFYNPPTGAGQRGVEGASGLNNIGLLIRAWGIVTEVGDGYLYADDGGMLRDGTYTGAEENIGIRVICDPTEYSFGDFIQVTGISSCFKTAAGWVVRQILTRGPQDVLKIGVSPVLVLGVSPPGGGTTTPPEGTYTYDNTTTVVPLCAIPSPGYVFDYWDGAVADPSLQCTEVLMDVSKTVTAVFIPVPTAAKRKPDGAAFSGNGAIVSAVFEDFFYVEADNRESGIRVDTPAHGLAVGMRADLEGTVRTNADGERYIDATSAVQNGTGSVGPLGMTNRSLGGGDWQYDPPTGAGQKGIAGAHGLNNIGLLVGVWGQVTSTGADYFVIDDGSGVDVKCVVPTGVTLPAQDAHVSVTGISSCEKHGDDLHRLLRVRAQEDIVAY